MKAWKYSNVATNVSHVVNQPNIRTPHGDLLMSEQLTAYQQGVDGESIDSFLHRSNPIEGFCQARVEASWRIPLVFLALPQLWCQRVYLSLWDQSIFLWVSTCDPATIINLGRFSSSALLSCHTASLEKVADELVFHKLQTANQDARNQKSIKMNVASNLLHYSPVESVQCLLMVSAGMVTSAFARGRLMAGVTSTMLSRLCDGSEAEPPLAADCRCVTYPLPP